ncbi:MAG TPA: GntR family transcriptional regulator [Glaciihabitans sp.]|jgi:DNA-binding transcriptional regulator YhcF (GntR family)|nr:GntR family transcriptional regulator [Glaciihabitans sp.]
MIQIDQRSGTAPFEQLRTQIIGQITDGTLPAGTRLPTVRRLADDLGIAPNTVARAYRELEADGFIETRGRNGSFINAQGDVAEQQAQVAARAYADRIHQLGISPQVGLSYVTAALRN